MHETAGAEVGAARRWRGPRLWAILAVAAVVLAGGAAAAWRLTDSGGGAPGGAVDCCLPTAAGIAFRNAIIDPAPPSGDGCCLDVIVAGDVDGDGWPDLVIGAEHADGLSWYRNPGTATRASSWERFPIGAGDFTTDGAVADLDGDGDLDVVASSIDRDGVEWWEQVGDPATPDGWSRHDVGASYAHDLDLADLDGDGALDVVAFHKDVSRIDWYRQPADPRQAWSTVTVDEIAGEGLAVADIDDDGDVDLVAGPAVYSNADGSGTEWSRSAVAVDWPEAARPAVGDIDGDGIVDIVLSAPESDGPLAWFRGPSWTQQVIDEEAGYTHSLELGDVDGDGDLDLLAGVMHWAGSREVRVLLGDGGATWTPMLLADTGTHNAVLVDLDGDQRLDVVGKNFDGPKAVEVWWNLGGTVAVPSPRPEAAPDAVTPLDGFTYVEVDAERARFNDQTAFFGLGFGDLDGDGDDDIASGGYVYLNPGGDMTGGWERVELEPQVGATVDAMLVVDVDGDERADVIATALPDVWWLEAGPDGRTWTGQVVASVPATTRPNGQGYRLGDLTGDGRPEIVLSGGPSESEVWYLAIPDDPATAWPAVRVTTTATDEQVGIGDIDGDGDNDLVAGDMKDGGSFIAWFANPGDGTPDWQRTRLGEFPGVYPDRLDVGDIDGDGLLDVVVSEENGGEQADAEVMWYQHPGDAASASWTRHVVTTGFTTNGLDLADIDGDGDLDLTTGEHRGSRRLTVWENTGRTGTGDVGWEPHPVDEGKESHLGARLWDLDHDGDLEIVSIAWDDFQLLHLWVDD